MTGLSLKSKAVVNRPFAERPAHAKIDDRNRICLLVNYFKLEYKKDIIVYHYDINIYESTKEKKQGRSLLAEGRTAKEDIKKKVKHVEREKRRNLGKARCRAIVSECFKNNEALKKYCPVYDGQKNLFTSRKLPSSTDGISFPVDVKYEEEEAKRYYVAIAPVEKSDGSNIISLEPLIKLYQKKTVEIPNEVLLVYETVMNHRVPPLQQVHFRSSFFNLRDRKVPLGCGLEIWFGYSQSIQLTDLGPVTVINLAAKAFYTAGSVIDTASDILGRDVTKLVKLDNWQIKSLTETLKGLKVKVTHQRNRRPYTIKTVITESARDMKQDIKGKKISIADYFSNQYRKLNYPQLPLLQMQSNNKTYMPMEVCEIVPGQPKVGKLSGDLTSKMIKSTAVPPQQRKDNILSHAHTANNFSKMYMDAFGLFMELKMVNVDGRIIAAPQLSYGGNVQDKSRIARPDNKGVWRIEDGKQFYKYVTIKKWVVVSFADRLRNEDIAKYCDFLLKSARKCGMKIDPPCPPIICSRNVTTEQAIKKVKQLGADFAIVVLNRRDNHHSYDEVKFLADFKYNLVTQCMEDKTLFRINDQITTNVCLKINVKLGGINHILLHTPTAFKEPVIVLGIDAIHWARGYGYPSILSVVGSLNPTASRYALICDLQKNEKQEKISQEIIRDMKSIALQMLENFRKACNLYPRKIIVFRDGVSEGQFQHALNYEVSGIQQACKELTNAIIPITFIVVQKRHQTRLFPVNPRQGVGRNQNVPPGTCVDQKITHPVYFDYFICSHEGIQGTSKPAKYTVLHDDIKLPVEELQSLCYNLCHTYVRCTRSVSLPAPVMYADLAAARAKKYADLHISPDTMSVFSGSSEGAQKDLPPEVEKAIRSMQSFDNNMFYV